jgi:hypothetical protein
VSSRRKPAAPPPELLPREDAAAQIAGYLADRTAYVIAVPPALVTSAAGRLAGIGTCRWYADNGALTLVLRGRAIAAAGAVGALAPDATTAVAVVPKAVPARRLSGVLGHEIPADGSKDLVMLAGEDQAGTYTWPMLLVLALDRVYPGTAARITASALSRLS